MVDYIAEAAADETEIGVIRETMDEIEIMVVGIGTETMEVDAAVVATAAVETVTVAVEGKLSFHLDVLFHSNNYFLLYNRVLVIVQRSQIRVKSISDISAI